MMDYLADKFVGKEKIVGCIFLVHCRLVDDGKKADAGQNDAF